jgi:2-polyprenyl-3-methyl-5-hydroxy-6-metoxy-1,4-benzoquinol methylase
MHPSANHAFLAAITLSLVAAGKWDFEAEPGWIFTDNSYLNAGHDMMSIPMLQESLEDAKHYCWKDKTCAGFTFEPASMYKEKPNVQPGDFVDRKKKMRLRKHVYFKQVGISAPVSDADGKWQTYMKAPVPSRKLKKTTQQTSVQLMVTTKLQDTPSLPEWSVLQVQEWLIRRGEDTRIVNAFSKAQVDGATLEWLASSGHVPDLILSSLHLPKQTRELLANVKTVFNKDRCESIAQESYDLEPFEGGVSPLAHPLLVQHQFVGYAGAVNRMDILVAGGGRGDSTLSILEKCRDHQLHCRLVHVDVSQHAINIARRRARAAQLDANVTFIHGAISDLQASEQGLFDFIECIGVIHHLSDPIVGLAQLQVLLKSHGVLALGVFSQVRGDTQRDLMALSGLLPGPAEANQFIDHIPREHPFASARFTAGSISLSRAGCVKGFAIPELVDVLQAAGLEVGTLMPPAAYDPKTYMDDRWADSPASKLVLALPPIELGQIAELLGSIEMHHLYAKKNSSASVCSTDRPAASVEEGAYGTAVPCRTFELPNGRAPRAALAVGGDLSEPVDVQVQAWQLVVTLTSLGHEIFLRSNCTANFRQIFNEVRSQPATRDLEWSTFLRHADGMVDTAQAMALLHLRKGH